GLARMFAAEGEGGSVPIDLRTHACTTFVALGGGGIRGLDVSVFDGDGAEVAVDSVEGEGGLVHLCPQDEDGDGVAPYYFVYRALRGSGAVVAGAFSSAPAAGEGFERIFEGILAPRVPFEGVREGLAQSGDVLRERGFLPLGDAVDGLAEGERVRLDADLSEARCYIAVARGDESVGDIDIVVFDPAGVEVGRNFGADAEPVLEHCPAEPGRYRFEATAFEGAGAVGIAVLSRPIEAEGDAPGFREEDSIEERRDAVETVDRLALPLRNRNYGAPSFLERDGTLGPDDERTIPLRLSAGCYALLGAGRRLAADLDLYVLDGQGNVVARDTSADPTARVQFCSDGQLHRAVVKGYGRPAGFALAVVAAPREIRDIAALRLDQVLAPYIDRGYVSIATLERSLDEGEAARHPVQVRPEECVAWVAAGGEGVVDVDLLVRDGRGRLIASAAGAEPHASAHWCADEGAELLVGEVLAFRGQGTVVIQRLVFPGPEPTRSPERRVPEIEGAPVDVEAESLEPTGGAVEEVPETESPVDEESSP
ncbi:MAG: hypothetical protein AAGF12_30365, partial [Myxococcota bacterium]